MKKVELNAPFDESAEEETQTINFFKGTDNELKPDLKILTPYNATVASEVLVCSTGGLKMPKILAQLVMTIKKQYQGIPVNAIINMVLSKCAQMITAKRIKYIEYSNIGYPNYYAIIFMPSGTGKDRMSDDLDKYVFFPFRQWFKFHVGELEKSRKLKAEHEAIKRYPEQEQEKQRKAFIKEQTKEFRKMVIEVSDGTREGLYCDAKAFKQAPFGSLMLKNAEFGRYLDNMKTEQRLFLNVLFEGYGGIIRSKCIKGDQREENVEDVALNALLYSDPTLFKSSIENFFYELMQTGLNRRSVITFASETEPFEMEKDPKKADEATRKYYSDLKAIGEKLYNIFHSIESNAMYERTQDTLINVFYPYKLKLTELVNNNDKESMKREITSRELKALKISCLYACINHPNECLIEPEDMEMAIDTIERLSKDFSKFLNYRPKMTDRFDRLFQLFLDNQNKTFTKTELVNEHYQLSGYSRKYFRKNFDECIEIVEDIASQKGYILNKVSINNNSGFEYSLIPMKSEDLSDGIKNLKDLI